MKRIIKFPKVRITDNRPTAAKSSPVERRAGATTGGSVSGLDYLEAIQSREKAEHDRAIRDYDEDTLLAAAEDLAKRRAWDRRNAEHRWIMGRVAAIQIGRAHV